MSRLPPPTPPTPPESPQFHAGSGGRRILLFFSIGALILVLGFLAFAGAEAFYLVRNGKAQVTDGVPSDLPTEIPICAGFKPAHTIVVDTPPAKRYEVQGDCPESRLQMVDDMTNQMAYIGWTVVNDGAGNLSGYMYSRHERIDIVLSDSNSGSNQTTVTMTMQTAVNQVPSDFPPPPRSPSPTAR